MLVFVDYQYKEIGGVAQIVVNTTLELNRRGLESKVYCSTESYEYKKLKESNARFLFINSDTVKLKALPHYINKDDCIILTNIVNTPLLECLKGVDAKILFYAVHPETFRYNKWLDFFCKQSKAVVDFIETIWGDDGLCIMDWPNLKPLYEIGVNKRSDVHYLPVPVKSYLGISRNSIKDNNHIITYLGRGNAEWKIFPVIRVLNDLNKLDDQFKLVIITDVNSLFTKMINEYVPHNRVDIEFVNNLSGIKLDRFLYDHSFLHIAMGTSALEGAKLGIPTILVDICNEEFPEDYLYRWLYETSDFCLAGEIKDGISPYPYGEALNRMLDQIGKDGGYMTISNKCKLYVDNYHSIESFVDNILKRSRETKLTCSIYCSTKFSKNMKTYIPIIELASRIKHFFK